MSHPKKKKFEDDGRIVAPMNVDGMPWYNNKLPKSKTQNTSENEVYKAEKTNNKETIKLVLSLYKIILPLSIIAIAIMAGVIAIISYVWLK